MLGCLMAATSSNRYSKFKVIHILLYMKNIMLIFYNNINMLFGMRIA